MLASAGEGFVGLVEKVDAPQVPAALPEGYEPLRREWSPCGAAQGSVRVLTYNILAPSLAHGRHATDTAGDASWRESVSECGVWHVSCGRPYLFRARDTVVA